MDQADAEMWSPRTALVLALPPPSTPPAEAPPAPPPFALMPETRARALTPRTRAIICKTVPRQYPREYEYCNRSWLATQVWKYFDDTGYETSSVLGVAGHSLKAQHKCRCLYCDQVVRATPTKMATHIVSRCQIADGAAKRALRTGKVDLLTTLEVANPCPKPRRPRCLMVAPTCEESPASQLCKGASDSLPPPANIETAVEEAAAEKLSSSVFTQASSQVLDYVNAFKWDSGEISVRSASSIALIKKSTKETNASTSLEEAVREAEEKIFSKTCKLESVRQPSCRDAVVEYWGNTKEYHQERCLALLPDELSRSSVKGTKLRSTDSARLSPRAADKENMPPSDHQDANARLSTAKKRKLEDQKQRDSKKLLKTQESAKKRLFDNRPSDSNEQELPPSGVCDVEAIIRDLTIACVTENVPIAFLSSAAFESTVKQALGVPSNSDFARLSSGALEELAQQVDAVCDSMKTSSSHLTFVVKRASLVGSNRAVVYLVDESTQSVLISCQQELHQISSGRGEDVWLDEVRHHYLRVSEWCDRPLHVSISGYPTTLQRRLIEAIDSSTTFAQLFGGCMIQEFTLLRQDTMEFLSGSPNAVQGCAELALLVNEAERFPLSGRPVDPAIQLSIPSPRCNQIYGYAVLLKQVLAVKNELAAKCQVADAGPRIRARKRSGILCRVKEIIDSIQDEWAMVSETLQLLTPLAVVELLKINTTASLDTAMKPTSGVFFCMELWLFISISRSPLLTSADKRLWKGRFLSRHRVTRMDHQFAGLLLDPRIVGAGLSPAGRRAGRACVVELCRRMCPLLNTRNLAPQLADYLNKAGIFGDSKLWTKENTANPIVFWRGVQFAPELQAVALLVCSYAPVSPTASDQVQLPGADSDFDQAARVAQVRHHLQAQEIIRDPRSITVHTASELLKFLVSAKSSPTEAGLHDGKLGHNQALFEPEQFLWKTGDQSQTATLLSISQASQVYSESLRSMIDDAIEQSRINRVIVQEVQDRPSKFLLKGFSESWIDCSEAGHQAIHNVVSCLNVVV